MKKDIQIRVSSDTHKKLKIKAAKMETSIKKLIEFLLENKKN